MLVYSASSVPILQLALSGDGLSEQQLFDFAANFVRTVTSYRSRAPRFPGLTAANSAR